jgi:SAM-dependent methyltransferase
MIVAGIALAVITALWALNQISYRFLKSRILGRQKWDLNICCGRTDGGGINADIVRHADVPRFQAIEDIYRLPFRDRQFDSVLCSHTLEHVADPDRFYRELRRVGRRVVLVLPPLWDISAALNVLEHRWIFLTMRKVHECPPRRMRLPFARAVQGLFGQRVHS